MLIVYSHGPFSSVRQLTGVSTSPDIVNEAVDEFTLLIKHVIDQAFFCVYIPDIEHAVFEYHIRVSLYSIKLFTTTLNSCVLICLHFCV